MQIKQSCLIAPHELHFQIVHHLLKDHIAKAPDYKVRRISFWFAFSWYTFAQGVTILTCFQVILFCSTEMVASLLYLLLQEMKMNVREIHSRKPQLYQTRVSNEFRESKQLILVTSDVLARGMNYPNVTLVVQVLIKHDILI